MRALLGSLVLLGGYAGSLGCTGLSGEPALVVPLAEAYPSPSEFRGRWRGESDDSLGFLEIQALGDGRFYGRFSSDDHLQNYVAKLTQEMATDGEEQVPGNVLSFDWQDGRGGIGSGWLMVDEDSSALTGELIYGESNRSGVLAFVRDSDVAAVRADSGEDFGAAAEVDGAGPDADDDRGNDDPAGADPPS